MRAWIEANGFDAAPGTVCSVPGESGTVARVVAGVDPDDFWGWAQLAAKLPAGTYRIDGALPARQANGAALAWALASYKFGRYKPADTRAPAKLVWPKGADRAQVARTANAIFWTRDLVNTPASDMGPKELADEAALLARRHKAMVKIVVGEALLDKNYPAIHAVGRASTRAPRLIDIVWGSPRAPKVTLVGKGVCFDSGGLDLKPSAGMRIMKKDMGGAAHALALASMIMDAKLKVRLRVLIPAVENAVSGNAMRPLDVIATRKGLTVEIGNTDAEGRLILADCLAEADREKPSLLLDFATLTGAARVALGPDLPALFTDDEKLAARLLESGVAEKDPIWRLPLWAPYRKWLDSESRRHQQRRRERLRRRDHRGAVPQGLRFARNILGAFRPVRLERLGAPRPARRRRGDGDPRDLSHAGGTVRLRRTRPGVPPCPPPRPAASRSPNCPPSRCGSRNS